MSFRTATRLIAAAVLAATVFAGAPRLSARDEDFKRLRAAWIQQRDKGQGKGMEQAAILMQQMAEGPLSSDPTYLAEAVNALGLAYNEQGRLSDAEAQFKRALRMWEQIRGAEHRDVATNLNNLARVHMEQGRYAEAEPLLRRALAIWEKHYGVEQHEAAMTLHVLAHIVEDQGRYAEAEPLFLKALGIYEKVHGPENAQVANFLKCVGAFYLTQGRYAEAESIYKRGLAIGEKTLGPEHPDVATTLCGLANTYKWQERYDEAEPLLKRAVAIREKMRYRQLGSTYSSLADLKRRQGKDTEAETLYRRAMAEHEKLAGADNPDVAGDLGGLSRVLVKQNRSEEAEPLLDRAIDILERKRLNPDWLIGYYRQRSRLNWDAKRTSEAVADLRRAMELAEQLRTQSPGAEHERAEFFAQFSGVFEDMVARQIQLGDLGEAFSAMERARARSLLDDLNRAGADLNAGRSVAERKEMQRRERDMKTQVASLEKQLLLAKDPAERERIDADLRTARDALYQYYRDQRSTSPVYRNLLATGGASIRLSQLERQVIGSDGLLLAYLIGKDGSFVMSIGGGKPRVTPLVIDEPAARVLHIKAGPLTNSLLHQVLVDKDGVLKQLASMKREAETTAKLAVLWQRLVPEADRKTVTGGKLKRLIIIPDGPLAMLPFETLVVEAGEPCRYLLDVGPPIFYGPSATVLYNLTTRMASKPTEREPVLTVGNPTYGPIDVASGELLALSRATGQSGYRSAGGKLTALPNTEKEVQWIVECFRKAGMSSLALQGDQATKAQVVSQAEGRWLVHLACHGMTDQTYGNFYGALALTPVDPKDPANDGFLTLAEICEMDLKGCELAVLSACETNYGPQQQGEGVWALSRGFLVAGARRVVASNWLVDDAAAANLVSRFCDGVAAAEKDGKSPNYAESLWKAKRWVRNNPEHPEWENPCYWAPFVLVGPN
jgi:CHAT domain-containing protein/Tfp pilus assembly protein PilF